MVEFIVVATLGFVALAVLGVIAAVGSLLGWIIALPFKLAALAFKGIAFLLALPFMLLFGILGLVLFGAGMLVFLLPAIPFLLLAVFFVWLFRRGGRSSATVTS